MAVRFLVALALSFVLLAPVECVGYCQDLDETGSADGRCLSSCTTLLGHEALLGPAWILAPVLLVGVLSIVRRSRRQVLLRALG